MSATEDSGRAMLEFYVTTKRPMPVLFYNYSIALKDVFMEIRNIGKFSHPAYTTSAATSLGEYQKQTNEHVKSALAFKKSN